MWLAGATEGAGKDGCALRAAWRRDLRAGADAAHGALGALRWAKPGTLLLRQCMERMLVGEQTCRQTASLCSGQHQQEQSGSPQRGLWDVGSAVAVHTAVGFTL